MVAFCVQARSAPIEVHRGEMPTRTALPDALRFGGASFPSGRYTLSTHDGALTALRHYTHQGMHSCLHTALSSLLTCEAATHLACPQSIPTAHTFAIDNYYFFIG